MIAARLASISCPQTAAASASQGQILREGRKSGRRRMIGPTSGSRRKRWWKALMSSSTPSAKRIRSIAVASSSRPAGSSSSQTGGTVRRAGSTASARNLTRPGPGCQARTRTGRQSTCSNRVAIPRSTRRVRSVEPRPIRNGEGGRTSASSVTGAPPVWALI